MQKYPAPRTVWYRLSRIVLLTGSLFLFLIVLTQPLAPAPLEARTLHEIPGLPFKQIKDTSVLPELEAVDDQYPAEDTIRELFPVPSGVGVLANDLSKYTAVLTSSLLTIPTTGNVLNWQENGSFIYEPDEAFDGLATFDYQAVTTATVGLGEFREINLPSNSFRWVVNFGDLDGDNDLDIFSIGEDPGATGVWFNDGQANFTPAATSYHENKPHSSQLGDIDGDGDLDGIVADATYASETHQFAKYINDGEGNFSRTFFGPARAYYEFVLADLDGDDDLDMWAVDANNLDTQHFVFMNDGNGNFTDSGAIYTANIRDVDGRVAVGDLDKDGDLDIVVGGGAIFFNEGGLQGGTTGEFSLGNQQLNTGFNGAAVADLNNDSYLDIVQTGTSGLVWFNKGMAGAGEFTQAQSLAPIAFDVGLADVDDDGDVDIIGRSIFFNDGDGQFTVGQTLPSEGEAMENVAVGDLNGDGTVDIAWTADPTGSGTYRKVNVLLNQTETRVLNDDAVVRLLVGDVKGPVDITLSSDSVLENQITGTVVGLLDSLDPTSDTHTYTLVEGAGSEANDAFAIVGNQLVSNAIFDYEAGQSPTRRIRIRTDNGEQHFEKSLIIRIADEEPEPDGPPDQCNGESLVLYDSGDGQSSAVVNNVTVSNFSPLGCNVTGLLIVRLQGQIVNSQTFTGKVNRWNKLSSTTGSLDDFSFEIVGLMVHAERVRIAEFGGQLTIRLGRSEVCAPAEWGGDCVDGTPANLRLDGSGLFAGSGGLPMPDFVINQAPGFNDELARQSPDAGFLSLLKLSGKATGKKNLTEAKVTSVDGGYEISAALALGVPGIDIEKGCHIWVAITLFKSTDGLLTMQLDPIQQPDGLEFREGTLGYGCDTGILIGNTGLWITGVSGTVSVRPDMQFVSLGVTISPASPGADKLLKATVEATLFWEPEWGVALEGTAKTMKVFELGSFKGKVSESQMSFTARVNSIYSTGQVEFYAWWPDGDFHFSGSGKVTLGVPKGAFFSECAFGICVDVPPIRTDVGSVGVEGGQFTNGNIGFKGYVGFLDSQYGFFLDDDGNFDVGGVNEYTIAMPPDIVQARKEWVRKEALIQSGRATWDNPLSFPEENKMVLNARINPSDVISQVTVVNPSDTMFVVSAVDPLTVTLETPSGDTITPDNAMVYSAMYETTDLISYTQYVYNVQAAEIGDWQVIMEGDTTANPPILAIIGLANTPNLTDATVGDDSDPSQVEINWSLTSDTPVTVTVFANAGDITNTVVVTDTGGVTTTEVIPNFNGIPVATIPIAQIARLRGGLADASLDLSLLESGNYALWLAVDDGISPSINRYVTLLNSNEVAQIIVDNTASLPTSWTADFVPTIDRDTSQIVVQADAIPNADIDSYGFNISHTPNNPEEVRLGGFAQYDRDDTGEVIGSPYIRQTVDNVRPGETYYVSMIAFDEQSGWSVQSQEISVTVPAGDYVLSTPQSSYQVEPGGTASIPITLDVLSQLFYEDVYLELDTFDLPRGLTVLFEGDALGTTNLNEESASANLLVAADTTVPEGFYTFELLGLNGENEKTVHLTIQVGQPQIYLPIFMNNYVLYPDLVVQGMSVTPNTLMITVTNVGKAVSQADFWVDVYINPSTPPSMVNQTWSTLSEEGMVWGVTQSLNSGESITLTIGDDFYQSELSVFSGTFSSGTPIYVQVDSANLEEAYGAVLENHEAHNEPYNNIANTVVP